MGADTKKLRNRIKSVNSTLHLTKAMGLVASSKIRRATDSMQKSREYYNSLNDVINSLLSSAECAKSPYMRISDNDRVCMIVVAGDRGLAGGYTANIFKISKAYSPKRVVTIGKRACDRYNMPLTSAEGFTYNNALEIAKSICDDFILDKFDKVIIVCTKYLSIMSQEAQIKDILPLERKKLNNNKGTILSEPDEKTILNTLIYEYVASMIYSSVRESFASEVAARRFAMDSAGKNAQEMLDNLQLEYNRARQGTITQEITEIVAGSDA